MLDRKLAGDRGRCAPVPILHDLQGVAPLLGANPSPRIAAFQQKAVNGATAPARLCQPCATPFSNSSLDQHRSDVRIAGFTTNSGVSKSAKVVLGSLNVEIFARR